LLLFYLTLVFFQTAVNNVCTGGKKKKDAEMSELEIMPVLDKGEKFVTKFGIVEVIRDDRAVPTAEKSKDIKKKRKCFKDNQARLEQRMDRFYCRRAAQLRVRRNRINALFEKDEYNSRTVFDAYTDSRPEQPGEIKHLEDPLAPANSFPDRIVECILIPDQRVRFSKYGRDDDDSEEEEENDKKKNAQEYDTKSPSQQPYFPSPKLYLTRRILTEKYDEDETVYSCNVCGQTFNCVPSAKYHQDNKPCLRRGKLAKERRDNAAKSIETKMVSILRPPTLRKTARPTKSQRRIGIGMYPQVLLCLGYKLVRDEANEETDLSKYYRHQSTRAPPPLKRQKLNPPQQDTTKEKRPPSAQSLSVDGDEGATSASTAGREGPDPDHPDEVIRNLQEELNAMQRKASDQQHGSMYAEVYHSLKFQFPGRKPGTYLGNRITLVRRRRRKRKPKTPLPPMNVSLPPIIDIQALSNEIDSGRYPSMNRYAGEDYGDVCVLCKDGGSLLCCDFCCTVEHLRCIRKKFTVKDPEPEDDFMCHKCIGLVLTKRTRAEKRRQQKLAKEDRSRGDQAEEGNEYQKLSTKGKDISELVELMKDSQLRLRQSVARVGLNNLRRKMITG
jgi:hypothetical protein